MSTPPRLSAPLSRAVFVLAVSTVGLAGASPASAAAPQDIVRECAQGTLSDDHTVADLSAALANLPADVAEYTDCADQLRGARQRALGLRRSTSPKAPSATPATPAGEFRSERAGSSVGEPAPRAPSAETPLAPAEGVLATEPPRPTASTRPEQAPGGPEASPVGGPVGDLAAAAIVGGSLATLARPAMLRRRRPNG